MGVEVLKVQFHGSLHSGTMLATTRGMQQQGASSTTELAVQVGHLGKKAHEQDSRDTQSNAVIATHVLASASH